MIFATKGTFCFFYHEDCHENLLNFLDVYGNSRTKTSLSSKSN